MTFVHMYSETVEQAKETMEGKERVTKGHRSYSRITVDCKWIWDKKYKSMQYFSLRFSLMSFLYGGKKSKLSQ